MAGEAPAPTPTSGAPAPTPTSATPAFTPGAAAGGGGGEDEAMDDLEVDDPEVSEGEWMDRWMGGWERD